MTLIGEREPWIVLGDQHAADSSQTRWSNRRSLPYVSAGLCAARAIGEKKGIHQRRRAR